MPDFIKNIGLPEIIIIGVLLLIFFGGSKVKELSRGFGESAKEVKKIKEELTKKEEGGAEPDHA